MGEVQGNTLKSLTANGGVTNTENGYDLYSELAALSQELFSVISHHCGKYALNALIIEDVGLGRSNANVFTKDGINILDRIDYISPLQTYIKNLISYIGGRVEAAAADGTTTSMMVAAKIINKFFEELTLNDVSYSERWDIINNFTTSLDRLKENLKANALSLEDIAEMTGKTVQEVQAEIAYIQSMIVSKGDRVLSECIKEIYEYTPVENNNTFYKLIQPYETDYRYKVVYPEEELATKVVVSSNNVFNTKLGTEFYHEDCQLIVASVTTSSNLKETEQLIDYLEKTKDNGKPVVFLYNRIGGDLSNILNGYNTSDRPVVCLAYSEDHTKFSDEPVMLQAIPVSAGKKTLHRINKNDPNGLDDAIIDGVTCHISGGYLFASGVYKEDEHNKLHPWFNNKEANKEYTDLIENIKMVISDLKHKHRIVDPKTVELYINALRFLISAKAPVLSIGGKSIDIYESQAVADDVLGAITATLDTGILIDGNFQLFKEAVKEKDPFVADAILETIRIIMRAEQSGFYDKMISISRLDDRNENYLNINYWQPDNDNETITNKGFQLDENGKYLQLTDGVIIHSYKLYETLLDRIKEVVPKIMSIEKIIVPGTANVKQ